LTKAIHVQKSASSKNGHLNQLRTPQLQVYLQCAIFSNTWYVIHYLSQFWL